MFILDYKGDKVSIGIFRLSNVENDGICIVVRTNIEFNVQFEGFGCPEKERGIY